MDDEPQTTLLDLGAKELNAYWVDPKQPLIIPNNPLHWKAHELQILLEILKKQASKNPAQFNSKNYIDTLNAYTNTIIKIRNGDDSEDEGMDERGMDSPTTRRDKTPQMGNGTSVGMDFGVSADNPLAG